MSNRASETIQGNLALSGVVEVLNYLSAANHTGALVVTKMPEELVARFYFRHGTLMRAQFQDLPDSEVLAETRSWTKGMYRFEPGVEPPPSPRRPSPPQDASPPDPGSQSDQRAAQKRSNEMATKSTDIMEQMLQIPGITAIVVIGRDGFVIEGVGGSERVDLDALGGSLAATVNGVEEMGQELKVDSFEDLIVEYGKAMIICRPLGDSIVAMLAPDASKLGIIRHKVKKPLEDLSRFV